MSNHYKKYFIGSATHDSKKKQWFPKTYNLLVHLCAFSGLIVIKMYFQHLKLLSLDFSHFKRKWPINRNGIETKESINRNDG